MMRVVLDTNILVSRYLTPRGVAAAVLSAWRADAFELLVSEPVLAEMEEVLLRPSIRDRHGLDEQRVRQLVGGFRRFATVVVPVERLFICEDPDDNIFLECAVAGDADVIVSRDPHLLDLKEVRGIRILTPSALLALLQAERATGSP